MRSSKSRSRNKSNRNRSVGNIVNRVFDSSGPEGKVRGTPQQIIDKYNQLARDAQLAGDRVATENFQQHAEHYLRLLGTALREQEAQREKQEQENRQRQADRDRERAQRQERDGQNASKGEQPGEGPQPDVMDAGDTGLVETPESKSDDGAAPEDEGKSKPKRSYNRRPRKPKGDAPKADGDKGDTPKSDGGKSDGGEKPAGDSDSSPAAAE